MQGILAAKYPPLVESIKQVGSQLQQVHQEVEDTQVGLVILTIIHGLVSVCLSHYSYSSGLITSRPAASDQHDPS